MSGSLRRGDGDGVSGVNAEMDVSSEFVKEKKGVADDGDADWMGRRRNRGRSEEE